MGRRKVAAWVGMALAAIVLAGCSSHTARLEDTPAPAASQPLPSGPLKAGDIMRILSGNKFHYTRGERTGTTVFNSDGTFTYQEDGKGEGTGIWQASDGSLCEAFNPTSFLPRGTRTECHPFAQTADKSYSAGEAVFQAM